MTHRNVLTLFIYFNVFFLIRDVYGERHTFYESKTDDSYLSLPINYPNPDLYKGDSFNVIDQLNGEYTGEQPLFPYVPEQQPSLTLENIDPNSNSNLQFCYDKYGKAQVTKNGIILEEEILFTLYILFF